MTGTMFPEAHSLINNAALFRSLFSWSQIFNFVFGYPVSINLLITNRCNLKCKICSAKLNDASASEISKEELIKFFEQIKWLRPSFFIGGGEPFMREDIFDIITYLNQLKLRFGLVTNGTLLNADKIFRLLNLNPRILVFSLHGDEKVHDNVTCVTGSYLRCCESIKAAVKRRKSTKIILNCVINNQNFRELENMIILGKKLGVDRVRFEQLIFLTKDEYDEHLKMCKEFSLTGGEILTYIKKSDEPLIGEELKLSIPRLQKKYGKFVVFKPYLQNDEIRRWYKNKFNLKRRCLFSKHSIFIKHNGDVIPCQFFPNYRLGNINSNKLENIWQNDKHKLFQRILGKKLMPGCMRCCKL
ncbi:MAG: radical SAM protein [Candidatus Omnitrophica bacterium]|nr:radical SAM protein [Candidatus Omnitrophota bacterium]